MKLDFSRRFGFLASEVAKLYGDRFDALARARLGLSRAQCRLLSIVAMSEDQRALSQAELAQQLDLTPMAVAGLCDRMEAAGWVRRRPSATDRRVNEVHLAPRAVEALDAAVKLGDALTAKALARLSAAERAQLIALLAKARDGLLALPDAAAQGRP
jgi:DNA-binding MarR family transcriptional regulator